MPNPDLPRLSSSKVVQDGVFNSNTGALSLTLIYLGFWGEDGIKKDFWGESGVHFFCSKRSFVLDVSESASLQWYIH